MKTLEELQKEYDTYYNALGIYNKALDNYNI